MNFIDYFFQLVTNFFSFITHAKVAKIVLVGKLKNSYFCYFIEELTDLI